MPNSFGKYLHACSCVLILIGFSAILITQSYLLPVAAGVGATLLYFALGDKLTRLSLPKSAWNLVAVALLGYLGYQSLFGDLDLIGNAIAFVVYLQIVKILSPKDNRDWYQIYLLSFLHILAATTISSDMSFAIPFILYLIVSVWTLTLFNIKVQQENAVGESNKASALRKLLRSTDIVTARFFGLTTALSTVIICIALIIFFIFPRVSMKNFLRRVSPKHDIAGFSGEVELGTLGKIQENSAIALRVELPANTIDSVDIEELYWRGTSSDFFDGKKWSQSFSDRKPVYVDVDDNILRNKNVEFPGGKLFEYNVLLEALTTPILFGSDRLMRVVWDKPIVEKFIRRSLGLDLSEEYGSYHFQSTQNFASDLTYKAESLLGSPSPELLRSFDGKKVPYSVKTSYLQLPDLDPKVSELISNIPVEGENVYDRARSIESFIERNYTYTLNVQDRGVRDPMRFFFVDKKRGHCGYFSTALILALRFHGIPARQVIGFRGGEYNPIGNYLAIRQNHAHGWAEVYFGKYGWIRFDPSPARVDPAARQASLIKSFLHMTDYLRLRWNKYIIEYDLRSQAAFIEKIGRRFSRIASRGSSKEVAYEADLKQSKPVRSFLGRLPTWLWILGPLTLAFWVRKAALSLFHRIKIHRYLNKMLRLLSRKGLRKNPHHTMEEFKAVVQNKLGPVPDLGKIIDMYRAERFGYRQYSIKAWEDVYKTLKLSISKHPKK